MTAALSPSVAAGPEEGAAPRTAPSSRPSSAGLRAYLAVRDDVERAAGAAREHLQVVIACGAGCSSCCTHDMPHLTLGEASALVELFETTPELMDVPELVFRQLDHVAARAAAGEREAALGTFPCPLLSSERRCRVYAARPWACVLCQSPDRRACETDAAAGRRDAWDPMRYLPTLGDVYRRVSAGTLRALHEAIDAKRSGNVLPVTLALAMVMVMVMDAPRALGEAAAEPQEG